MKHKIVTIEFESTYTGESYTINTTKDKADVIIKAATGCELVGVRDTPRDETEEEDTWYIEVVKGVSAEDLNRCHDKDCEPQFTYPAKITYTDSRYTAREVAARFLAYATFGAVSDDALEYGTEVFEWCCKPGSPADGSTTHVKDKQAESEPEDDDYLWDVDDSSVAYWWAWRQENGETIEDILTSD